MSTQPRYLKINGTWYVSKQHMAEQMEIVCNRAFEDGVTAGMGGAEAIEPPTGRIEEIVAQ